MASPALERMNFRNKNWGTQMEKLLTVSEAAERAGVSASLIYQWVDERRLAHYAAGHDKLLPGRWAAPSVGAILLSILLW